MTSQFKIAFVTSRDLAGLTPDDSIAADYLAQSGFSVSIIAWDTPSIRWEAFDAVVVRSTWDYHRRHIEFLAWLAKLERRKVRLWNPIPVIRENIDKIYLRKLSKQGVLIAPTVWVARGESVHLLTLLSESKWDRVVIKPSISATARNTWVTSLANAAEDQSNLDSILKHTGALIQPLVAEIQTRGEWSFVFFDKQFSHAVLKRTKAGEFRVQNEFGGYISMETPPPALLSAARKVIQRVDSRLLYARVDGVEVANQFVLMELELIEPELFFRADGGAAHKFADAIVTLAGLVSPLHPD
jgi:glutathione synthase/RimK-type ligase-like ATP-grasp enzyme